MYSNASNRSVEILIKAAEKIRASKKREITHKISMIYSFVMYALPGIILWLLFHNFYPADLSDLFWSYEGTAGMLKAIWPVLAWPVLFHLLVATLVRHDVSDKIAACGVLKSHTRMSMRAGIFEELIYRWLLPIGLMPILLGLNYIVGNDEEGIVALVCRALSDLANFTSFGIMENELITMPWAVGGAVVIANIVFRNGHKYQGLFGLLNSWFVGMYFFYLTFHYSLLTAMIVHAIYDAVIGLILYLDAHWDTRHVRLRR